MKEPNWQQFANNHNMSPTEFKEEIMKTAAALFTAGMNMNKPTKAFWEGEMPGKTLTLEFEVIDNELKPED